VDYHINTKIEDEGAVVDLVPMASTTVTMVIGDCIANALMVNRHFNKQEYGRLHPGGSIGKRLLLKVEDLLHRDIPKTRATDTIAEVAVKISKGKKGIAVIRDEEEYVEGILTDGDLRRLIESGADFNNLIAEEVMSKKPITVLQEESAIEALKIIENYDITQLVITNESGEFEGVLHVHDIIDEGLN
jgi:arabinose-5-phosphate isomerase